MVKAAILSIKYGFVSLIGLNILCKKTEHTALHAFFGTGNDKNVGFTTIVFIDWKHALGVKGILTLHVCKSHKQAMIAWKQAEMYAEKSVVDILGQIEKNRFCFVAGKKEH